MISDAEFLSISGQYINWPAVTSLPTPGPRSATAPLHNKVAVPLVQALPLIPVECAAALSEPR
jgi:hypothetical protein